MTAKEALHRLMEGNNRFLTAEKEIGDISMNRRRDSAKEGQNPFAIIITCADSRVIPEAVFQCGIGDLFVIRVAGNVIGSHELGSIEYAAEHLGTRLIMVLGHTGCGAVAAALKGEQDGHIRFLTDEIRLAIGTEKDLVKAAERNVKRGVVRIQEKLIHDMEHAEEIETVGAIYDLATGEVRLIQQEQEAI